jgi:anti-sigma B factor antagonist
MKHHIKEEQAGIIVSFEGDVDLESSPVARKVLLEAVDRRRAVIVDMSAVSYIDSSGIASLVEALQRARQGGSDFGLASVSDASRRVLQLARLDKVFIIHESLEDALASQAG